MKRNLGHSPLHRALTQQKTGGRPRVIFLAAKERRGKRPESFHGRNHREPIARSRGRRKDSRAFHETRRRGGLLLLVSLGAKGSARTLASSAGVCVCAPRPRACSCVTDRQSLALASPGCVPFAPH